MDGPINELVFASGFSLVMYGFFAALGIFILGVLGLWIWMIIDCAKHPFPQPEGNQRLIWILIIVLAGWVGALIYLFAVKIPGSHIKQ
jgi:hypothetical protein